MALGVTSKLFIAVLVMNIITAIAVGLGVRTAFVSKFGHNLRSARNSASRGFPRRLPRPITTRAAGNS